MRKEHKYNMAQSSCALLMVLSATCSLAFGEPLILEQAQNVTSKSQVELGLSSAYGEDKFTLVGFSGTDFTQTTIENSLFLRYGIGNRLEFKTDVPFVRWETEQESASSKTSQSESGLGDISAGLKYNMGDVNKLAYGLLLSFDMPTGDADKGLVKGFNANPTLLASKRAASWLYDVNLGYSLTGEYKVSGVKINPGDAVTYGASGGYDWNRWTLLTELRGETFGNEKQGGTNVTGTSGSRIDLTPGVRYKWKNLKAKAGVNVSLGDESSRLYDWQAFVGLSVVGKFSFRIE